MMPTRFFSLLICAVLLLTTTAHFASAQTDNFELAQQSYEQSDWQPALERFLKVAAESTEPKRQASAHFYAAECALQLKDYTRAISEYNAVLGSASAEQFQPRASFRSAEALYLSGRLPEAATRFQKFLDSYPEDHLAGDAYNYLGEMASQSGQHEQAIAYFNHVIEGSAQDQQANRARLGMARAFLASNRIEEVPIALGRLCQSGDASTAAEALLILGRAKYEAGQFDQSLTTFRRVYPLQAEPMVLHRARLASGWSLWKLSRCDEITEEIAPLAGIAETASEYHYLSGMMAYSAKNWSNASKEFNLATAEASSHRSAALFYRGESELRGGDLASARLAFQKLIDLEAESEWADDAMWGLVRAAHASQSKTEFQQACEILNNKYPTSDYVAQIPLLAKQSGGTKAQALPGLELFEEAVGLERDGHFDAALSAYHQFIEREKKNPFRAEGLWRTGRLHDRLKQQAEARKFYTQLLAEFLEFDRGAEALANLAWIESAAGNHEFAAKHCQELVAKFPQTAQAAEASYWLALAAADDERGDEAQWQVDWLLERLNPATGSHSESERRIYGQTLCLQCQLFAAENQWQKIIDVLNRFPEEVGGGAISARLDFWKAEAVLRLGDHDKARTLFENLVTQTVGINESWVPMVALRQAQLAARREDWQEVSGLVDELDKRFPEFELAYECDYLRGRVFAGRGEMSTARTQYGHVLKNEWSAGTEVAAMAQWMIGETYFHQRDYEHARIAYERVIERHSFPEWQARAALQAGKCAELSDNWEGATKYYAEGLDRWQQTRSAKELSARLQWVQEQVALKQATLRR